MAQAQFKLPSAEEQGDLLFFCFDGPGHTRAAVCVPGVRIVDRAAEEGIDWMFETLNREGAQLKTKVERGEGDRLELRWG